MYPAYLKERCDLIPNGFSREVQRFKDQLVDIGFLYARFSDPNLLPAIDKLKDEMRVFAEEEPPSRIDFNKIDSAVFVVLYVTASWYYFWAVLIVFLGIVILLLLIKLGLDMHDTRQHNLAKQSINDLTILCDNFSYAIKQENDVPAASDITKQDIVEEQLPAYAS